MAISRVQANSGTASSASQVNVPFSSDTTPGNTLIGISHNGFATTQPTSIADSNVTYTDRSSVPNASSAMALRQSNTDNCAGGPNTVTATWAASQTGIALIIIEYSGLEPTGSFDQQNTFTGNANALTTGNITTTFPDEVLVYAASTRNSPSGITVGTNFNEIDNFGNNRIVEVADRIVSATGTYSGTSTRTSGSDDSCALVCSYRAANPRRFLLCR